MNLAENLLEAPDVLLGEQSIGITKKGSGGETMGILGATFLTDLRLLGGFERDHLLELGFA